MTFTLTLLMASLGSVGSTAGAALLVLSAIDTRKYVPYLVSFATGTLLAGACFGLLPRALEHDTAFTVTSSLLIGLLAFFVLERLLIIRHSHAPSHHREKEAPGYMILLGDALHNFADGVAIGASFAIAWPLGFTAAIAVAAHEVPQEVADFGILIDSGFTKARAFGLNLLSASSTIPGAILSLALFDEIEPAIGIILALSASSFLYIGLADLMPRLHEHGKRIPFMHQSSVIGVGVLLMLAIKLVAEAS